jgi:hypothetical protein
MLMLRQSIIKKWKNPLKTIMNTRFGHVPDGRKKRFQDYRCRNVGSHWMMGIL